VSRGTLNTSDCYFFFFFTFFFGSGIPKPLKAKGGGSVGGADVE
jgi:hypothetical protein